MYSVFFTPRSVAVVGAANDPARLRGKLLKLVLNSGYAGPVYPVHPRGGVIQGKPAFASLAAIPGGVDLARDRAHAQDQFGGPMKRPAERAMIVPSWDVHPFTHTTPRSSWTISTSPDCARMTSSTFL